MFLESWMRKNRFWTNYNLSSRHMKGPKKLWSGLEHGSVPRRPTDTLAETRTLQPEINLCKTTLMSWNFNSDIRAQIIHRLKMNIWPNTRRLSACLCVSVSLLKKNNIFLGKLLNIYQVSHFWRCSAVTGRWRARLCCCCSPVRLWGRVWDSKKNKKTSQNQWSRKVAFWALPLGTHTCRWELQGSGQESLGSFLLQASSGWAGPGLKDKEEIQGN